jgi:hypothetical protein
MMTVMLTISPKIKHLRNLAAVCAALGLLNSSALASLVIEAGTSGSFASGVTGLQFAGGNQSWTVASSGNTLVNLGTLSWASGSGVNQKDDAFTLTVAFGDSPSSPKATYTADIWANYNGFSGFGDVWFDQINSSHFSYTTSEGTYSFDLKLAGTPSNGKSWGTGDTFVTHDWFNLPYHGSVQLQGIVSNAGFTPAPAAVPEPATFVAGSMLLLPFGGRILRALWAKRKA